MSPLLTLMIDLVTLPRPVTETENASLLWALSWYGRAVEPGCQPASKYEDSSRSWTALAWTRNDRPTRTAGSSPLCTSRYTVIFETLIKLATSATVRN